MNSEQFRVGGQSHVEREREIRRAAYEDAIALCEAAAERYGELSAVSAIIAAGWIQRKLDETD